MGHPGSKPYVLRPSKDTLIEHIHSLRSALRSTDARFRELLAKQQYFPSRSDEELLDNNAAVIRRYERGI
jgi:hypothetical protein